MKKNSTIAESRKPSAWASLAIAGICTSFGANAVAIKISLTGLGVFTTAGIRFLIAAIAITLWALATGRQIRVRPQQRRQLLLLSLLFTVQLGLFYLGLSRTFASRGALIANLQPFFVLILAHFFIPGDGINRKKIFGIAMGFAGVAILFLQKEGISAELRTGDLLVLGAVFLWGINAVYTKTIVSAFDPFQLVLYPQILSVPFFLLAGWLWEPMMVRQVDWKIIGAMTYQSLVTASFGFVCWTHMLQRYGAVTLHSYVFILPIAGVGFGGWILGEPIGTTRMLLALVLVVAGILLVHSDFSFVRRSPGL